MRARSAIPASKALAPLVALVLLAFPATCLAQTSPEVESSGSADESAWKMAPVDWIRAGILFGPQKDPVPSFHLGMKLSFFGLDWQHVYLVPFVFTFSGAARFDGERVPRHMDVLWAGELGYMHRWGRDELRIGLEAGLTLGGVGYTEGSDQSEGEPLAGAGIRPTVRYRHYWGRFGLEVSLEWPFVVGKSIYFSEDGVMDDKVKTWIGVPLLGVSVGM